MPLNIALSPRLFLRMPRATAYQLSMPSEIEAPDRPRIRRRKASRPGEILAAGIEEFGEHGFERARLDRIAAKAGIAKGTIYLYFSSKEALFAAAVEEHVVNLMEETESDLTSFNGPTEELIRRLLTRVYAKIVTAENQALMRILISESHRVPQVAEKYHDMALARGIAILQAVIARGIERGELRESAVTRNPQLITAPAVFVAIHNMAFDKFSPIDVHQYFEGHLELVLLGLGLKS